MTLYEQYQTALNELRELAKDLSPEGDRKFIAWKKLCDQMKVEIYFSENKR